MYNTKIKLFSRNQLIYIIFIGLFSKKKLYLIGIILCRACSFIIGLCFHDITLIKAWEDCDEKHGSKKITLNCNKNMLFIVFVVITLKGCVNYFYGLHQNTHKQNYFHFELYQFYHSFSKKKKKNYHIIDFFIMICM